MLARLHSGASPIFYKRSLPTVFLWLHGANCKTNWSTPQTKSEVPLQLYLCTGHSHSRLSSKNEHVNHERRTACLLCSLSYDTYIIQKYIHTCVHTQSHTHGGRVNSLGPCEVDSSQCHAEILVIGSIRVMKLNPQAAKLHAHAGFLDVKQHDPACKIFKWHETLRTKSSRSARHDWELQLCAAPMF